MPRETSCVLRLPFAGRIGAGSWVCGVMMMMLSKVGLTQRSYHPHRRHGRTRERSIHLSVTRSVGMGRMRHASPAASTCATGMRRTQAVAANQPALGHCSSCSENPRSAVSSSHAQDDTKNLWSLTLRPCRSRRTASRPVTLIAIIMPAVIMPRIEQAGRHGRQAPPTSDNKPGGTAMA